MQYPQPLDLPQLPLFQEALWANAEEPLLAKLAEPDAVEDEAFSELSLRGLPGHCQSLLAPILRELSEEKDARWLTLIAPPASLTHDWLRKAGLNRERILLLPARDQASALSLACEALRLGHSHTVVSWLPALSGKARAQLSRAALAGQAQSLNIRLG
ncbi:cell division inhibitor SulA [Pseudomonas citronellolis]|uniref:Cell division inhibitor SulA n=1 Tax=Pseudomonas citronellolis TaxID=53408 RepID=A0AAQ1KFE6_9PSED|nr:MULTISPECIES: SOS-induced cell division inhibitor SulA [Pseudomonas]MCL6692001.1 CDP-glycerol--UDP-pyrophosphoryl-N-acetylglucosaminyl-N-acetylmannosamine glycerophosphotransferase [Pseudomonas sp. R3.Fl]MDN6872494.1 SOS-induced cell division inhibitor SulA [Pseudomonas citronellolis]TGC32787.1 CDP-glycerol--UDP-pyrophosphoryl-N-acetylglucosaminyl-N-acetylmannosamine glycerophosphotransferase [Pseudomonas citronellolis]UUC52135.1 SulA-like leucine-rich domain-containing protein [Pseudomonas 